ncbi:MAG: Crp/Fnr family transcriptional regulator [Anaerolineae bacterium]
MTNSPTTEHLTQQLRTSFLFTELDTTLLRELAQGALWREYSAGEVVVLEGENPPGLFFLQSGWLKVVKVSSGGREQVLRFLEPGETFNEISVFANRPMPATVIALEPAGIWTIRRQAMMHLLQERPEFAQHVLAKMAERMLFLVSLVTDLSLRPVTGRLARLLLEDAVGDVLYRPRWYTQAELASRLGTVPDVIQRALRTLEKDGLIEVQRQLIRILNRPALEKMAA